MLFYCRSTVRYPPSPHSSLWFEPFPEACRPLQGNSTFTLHFRLCILSTEVKTIIIGAVPDRGGVPEGLRRRRVRKSHKAWVSKFTASRQVTLSRISPRTLSKQTWLSRRKTKASDFHWRFAKQSVAELPAVPSCPGGGGKGASATVSGAGREIRQLLLPLFPIASAKIMQNHVKSL